MTGKTSRFPLTRLAAKYNEALEDPELVALREPLAITIARRNELLERIEENDTPERWELLLGFWQDFKENRGSPVHEATAFFKLDHAFQAVYHDYKSWEQVMDLLETERKLSESERKRLVEMKQMMSAEEAYKLLAQVKAAIIRVLQDDPDKLKALQFELIRIAGDEPGGRSGGGDKPQEVIGPSGLDTERILDTRIARANSSGAVSAEVLERGSKQG